MMTEGSLSLIMEEIPKLYLELGTAAMINFDRAQTPIKAVYVGMERGSYIILRCPTGVGVHDFLFEGNRAVVKYVSKGQVFGFKSKVMGYMFKKRLILVVMEYPDLVETHDLRGERRIEYLTPARLSTATHTVEGFVVDISTSGCKFVSDEPGADNINFIELKHVNLSFQLVGREGMYSFGCEVKNIRNEKKTISLGLMFSRVDAEAIQGVKEYVEQVSLFME